jgi:hypothetical protein
MSFVRERFNPVPMAADSTYLIRGAHMGGFLAKTAGTITITTPSADGLTTITIVDAVPLTAGIYTPIPVMFPYRTATVTLAGGASGTLMV